jgi:hypothetical protein
VLLRNFKLADLNERFHRPVSVASSAVVVPAVITPGQYGFSVVLEDLYAFQDDLLFCICSRL